MHSAVIPGLPVSRGQGWQANAIELFAGHLSGLHQDAVEEIIKIID
jgi:hypothetical protein